MTMIHEHKHEQLTDCNYDIDLNKSIAFAPYCCKPMDCPAGRKNQSCYRFTDSMKCNRQDCTIGLLIDRLNISRDRFFVIDRDENLLEWLDRKWSEGYRYYYPGCGCEYGYEKTKDVIRFTGKPVFICGDVCDREQEYQSMETGDKGKLTRIPINQIKKLSMVEQS